MELPEFRIITDRALMDEIAARLNKEGRTMFQEVPDLLKAGWQGLCRL